MRARPRRRPKPPSKREALTQKASALRGLFVYPWANDADVFVERASEFSEARRLIHADAEYASTLALLAVHAAISWNDAVLVKLGYVTVKNEDHMAAARATRKQCSVRRLDSAGIKHLQKLIGAKSKVSFGNQRTTSEVAQDLSIASERFEEWANRILSGKGRIHA